MNCNQLMDPDVYDGDDDESSGEEEDVVFRFDRNFRVQWTIIMVILITVVPYINIQSSTCGDHT